MDSSFVKSQHTSSTTTSSVKEFLLMEEYQTQFSISCLHTIGWLKLISNEIGTHDIPVDSYILCSFGYILLMIWSDRWE